MTTYLKHMRAAGAWALYSLEAETEAEERKCRLNADYHLFEAQRLRRNALADEVFNAKLTLELQAIGEAA
jgi:hypothetical protein